MVKVNVHPWWHKRMSLFQYQRGLNYLRGMAYQQAIAAFAQAITCHPRPSDVLVMRGIAYAQLGQMAAAFVDYDRAILLNPNQGKAYAKRGLLHESQGNVTAAQADWERAIALATKDPEVYYRRGLKALNEARETDALQDFDRAIAFNPNFAEAYFQRGNLRYTLGDTQNAVMDWELSICNDFGQDDAKLKLEAVRRAEEDDYLTEQLRAELGPDGLGVEVHRVVRNRRSLIEVVVERPLGMGIDYQALPHRIRRALVPLELQDVYQFQLVGRIKGTRFQDWQQRYRIYENEPCPPRHWRLALLMLIASPPFGMSALLCGYQVGSLYKRGKYPQAQQASQLVKSLCYFGGSLTGFVLVMALASQVLMQLRPEIQQNALFENFPALGESKAGWADRMNRNCPEGVSRSRCLLYRKQAPKTPNQTQ